MDCVEQVMRSLLPLFGRRFGGTNLEIPVAGHRVAVHDFAFELLRQADRERGFPATSRSDNRNQNWIAAQSAHAPWDGVPTDDNETHGAGAYLPGAFPPNWRVLCANLFNPAHGQILCHRAIDSPDFLVREFSGCAL